MLTHRKRERRHDDLRDDARREQYYDARIVLRGLANSMSLLAKEALLDNTSQRFSASVLIPSWLNVYPRLMSNQIKIDRISTLNRTQIIRKSYQCNIRCVFGSGYRQGVHPHGLPAWRPPATLNSLPATRCIVSVVRALPPRPNPAMAALHPERLFNGSRPTYEECVALYRAELEENRKTFTIAVITTRLEIIRKRLYQELVEAWRQQ